MLAKFRSWWQKTKKPLEVFAVFVGCLLLIALLVVIILAYIFKVNVPGLSGKTLWDWLQLLIIPAVLAIGGYLFTYTTSRNDRAATEKRTQAERDIAADNQRETALQAYFDKMSELLFEKNLRESQPKDEVRSIARARTLTVLRGLDGTRKGSLLQFLYEADLIPRNMNTGVLDLKGADLSRVDMHGANMSGSILEEVDMERADLRWTDLSKVILSKASLPRAWLIRSDLSKADLREAFLGAAHLNSVNLRGAKRIQADLRLADLRDADLSNAYLGEANLSGADLRGADLNGASLYKANLREAKVTPEQLDVTTTEEKDFKWGGPSLIE